MHKAYLLSFLLTFGGTALAQQHPTIIFVQPRLLALDSCPVGFSVAVDTRLTARLIDGGKKNGEYPLLDLTLKQRNYPEVRDASITVHGFSASTRYLPVGDASSDEKTESLRLMGEEGEPGLNHRAVRLNRVPLVRWAEITEITYADGTSWHSSAGSRCRAEVSPFRLIGASAQ